MAETHLWHPFAAMGAVKDAELVLDRGEDVWVWDADGKRYLDATASLWYCNVGHGRKELADAAAAQFAKLEAYSAFGDFANQPALDLADRLSSYAPMDNARVFLGSGGGDAIDTAAKLARRYFQEIGEEGRTHLISRSAGYHGTHGYGTAIAGIPPNRDKMGPLPAETSQVEHSDLDALRAEIERVGPETIAAFFMEPVIGAGGVYPPAEGYIEGAAALCKEHGILLVVDSVICAFGRLGTWFGIERWPGVRPDMITFAKGVTSGYLPVGGVMIDDRVAAPFWAEGGPPFRHGATYAGHATCCAVALANLDLLESEGLLAKGQELEGELLAALQPCAEHDLVSEVRGGIGTLAAVGLKDDLIAERPGASIELAMFARESDVLVRPLGAGVAASPPLTATAEHFKLIGEAVGTALEKLEQTVGAAA